MGRHRLEDDPMEARRPPSVRQGHQLRHHARGAGKRREKEEACELKRYDFLPWAVNARGGIGSEGANFFTKGIAAHIATCTSDGDKWRVRNNRKRLLAQHAAIIAKGNWGIFQKAWPRMGGLAPPPPLVDFEE